MKLFFFLLTSVLFHLPARAQSCSISAGHAYQRTTIPGKMPRKDLNESGKEIEAPIKMMNTFFIYIETKDNCIPNVTRLWIQGKAYHAIQEPIEETPIVVPSSHPGNKFDTLVRKTSNKVFRIHPREEMAVKPGKTMADKLERASIIIEYGGQWKGSFYQIKKIKKITPVVLQ